MIKLGQYPALLLIVLASNALAQDGGETEVVVGATGPDGSTISRHRDGSVQDDRGNAPVTATTPAPPAGTAPDGGQAGTGRTQVDGDKVVTKSNNQASCSTESGKETCGKAREVDGKAKEADEAARQATLRAEADARRTKDAQEAAKRQQEAAKANQEALAQIEHSKQSQQSMAAAQFEAASENGQFADAPVSKKKGSDGKEKNLIENLYKVTADSNKELEAMRAQLSQVAAASGTGQQGAQDSNKQVYLSAIEQRRRLIAEIFNNAQEVVVEGNNNREALRVLQFNERNRQRAMEYINGLQRTNPQEYQRLINASTIPAGTGGTSEDLEMRQFGVRNIQELNTALPRQIEFQDRSLRISDGYIQMLQREAQGYQVQVERVYAPLAGVSGAAASNLASAASTAAKGGGASMGDITGLLKSMQGLSGGSKGGSSGSSGGSSGSSARGPTSGSFASPSIAKKDSNTDPFAKSSSGKSEQGNTSGSSRAPSLKSALQASLAGRSPASAGSSSFGRTTSSGSGLSKAGGGLADAADAEKSKNTSGIRGADKALPIGDLDANSRRAAIAGATASASETQEDINNMSQAMLAMMGKDGESLDSKNAAERNLAGKEEAALGNINEPLFDRVRQSIARSIEKGNLINGLSSKLGG